MMVKLSTGTLLAALCLAAPVRAQLEVDPKLPSYTVVKGVSGRITSKGSDTMNNLMTHWAEGFKKLYPSVEIEITGAGSSVAPPALIAGTASFGPMSREMKNEEIDAFKKQFGYAPTGLRSSIDMLSVYVHKDNPLKGLTMAQLDAIFSKTRKAGHKEVRTWGDLGLEGEWADKPISLHGRNNASGTYGYFKEHVLRNGDYKPEVKQQPGSAGVVQGVAADKFAIGYSGFGYRTADVKEIPLALKEGGKFVPVEPSKAYTREYPLSRDLFIYVNHKPGEELDLLRRGQFIRYVLSKEGQTETIKAGYLPVKSSTAKKTLAAVGIK